MVNYRDLWQELCGYHNLELAFKKARKHKTLRPCVLEFEADLHNYLLSLRTELLLHSYRPKLLQTFIIHDPKTRKISKSHFRDRVINHAICNIIEPLFEKQFIYDSYANRKGKGTLKAVERFDYFKRKVSKNNTRSCFVLKADVRHYFETVDHQILLTIIQKRIRDPQILWLIRAILNNYHTTQPGKGMPLGNLTSQFFANVYLNELDQFVKQDLKARYYIRYVDDFIIFNSSKETLQAYFEEISSFLQQKLVVELHPDKSRIIPLYQGTEFLGFKIFLHHRLIKKKNIRKFYRKWDLLCNNYSDGLVMYDSLYDFLEGWCAHAAHASTYARRQKILSSFEQKFPSKISTKEINRNKKYFFEKRKKNEPKP